MNYAYEEGYKAYVAGLDRESNPYDLNIIYELDSWEDWEYGWCAGDAEFLSKNLNII